MTGTWTFQDGNQITVSSTIAQNEFTFQSQGQSGVAKLQNTTAHGTREVKLWRQSAPDSLAHPSLFEGEMDLTTGVIHFGSTLKLSPPAVVPLNLAQMVVVPKLTVDFREGFRR